MLSKERKGPIHGVSVCCCVQMEAKNGVVALLNIELYQGLKRVVHPLFPKNVVQC